MEYAIIAIVIMVLLFIEFLNEMKSREKLKNDLIKAWGNKPNVDYNDEIYNVIAKYYRIRKETATEDEFFVDDITWSDLDMQGMYELINSTSSNIGREYLYYILRRLSVSKTELEERNELIKMFESDPNIRVELQLIMSSLGNKNKLSIAEYIAQIKNIHRKSRFIHILQALGLIASVVSILLGYKEGIIVSLGFVFINVASYYSSKAKIEPYLRMFITIVLMSKAATSISKLDNEVINKYSQELDDINSKIGKLKNKIHLLSSTKASGGFFDSIMDYVKMLFHVDIITFYSALNILQSNQDKIERLYEIIGLLDSMCAVASFRTYLPYYCEPRLVDVYSEEVKGHAFYDVKEIYHPFIKNPIANSIKEDSCVLLTGSNASGKSTFIKVLAINALLSQTIFTSISRQYNGCFYHIYSSMALKDNLVNNESYYMVEIKSLKRILDGHNDRYPILCFVDEVLRGTNTLERIAASSQILSGMAENGYMCFAATHDIELSMILSNYYHNYHFQENVENDDIVFDYMIQEGPATSRNAIKLLRIIGYSDEIIDNAEQRANYFINNGIWQGMNETSRNLN